MIWVKIEIEVASVDGILGGKEWDEDSTVTLLKKKKKFRRWGRKERKGTFLAAVGERRKQKKKRSYRYGYSDYVIHSWRLWNHLHVFFQYVIFWYSDYLVTSIRILW